MKLYLMITLTIIGSKYLRILIAIVAGFKIENWKYILFTSILYGLIKLIAQLVMELMTANKEHMKMVYDTILEENELPKMNKVGRLFYIFLVNTVFVLIVSFSIYIIKLLF